MDTTAVNQLHLDLVELNGRMQRVVDIIENVKDRQEEMAEDIAKIKGAVYNPDEGIYARLRELESWKKNTSKVMWMIVTSLVGLGSAMFFKTFTN